MVGAWKQVVLPERDGAQAVVSYWVRDWKQAVVLGQDGVWEVALRLMRDQE